MPSLPLLSSSFWSPPGLLVPGAWNGIHPYPLSLAYPSLPTSAAREDGSRSEGAVGISFPPLVGHSSNLSLARVLLVVFCLCRCFGSVRALLMPYGYGLVVVFLRFCCLRLFVLLLFGKTLGLLEGVRVEVVAFLSASLSCFYFCSVLLLCPWYCFSGDAAFCLFIFVMLAGG